MGLVSVACTSDKLSSHITLLILASIRAYGAEEAVIRESLTRIDKYSRSARTFYDLNRQGLTTLYKKVNTQRLFTHRWLGVRVDALGALFAAALATYLVYGPERHRAANIGFSLNMAGWYSRSL